MANFPKALLIKCFIKPPILVQTGASRYPNITDYLAFLELCFLGVGAGNRHFWPNEWPI